MLGINYTIVNLHQNTPEWLEWRSQGIDAFDAPAIMGEYPWKSADNLLREKCTEIICRPLGCVFPADKPPESEAARKCYERRFGTRVPPACLQSLKYDWMRASVDGLSADGSSVIEINCGEITYRRATTTGEVPNYYLGKLQHILYVTGLHKIDFWCYLPNMPEVHIIVDRKDSYIKRLLKAESEFWQRVLQQRKR
jgi:putative phage-type endonuclease